MRNPLAPRLPDFPWDTLEPAKRKAQAHPGGLVDLSVGTPADPTPEPIRAALTAAADAHGYPTVAGTADMRAAMVDYLRSRWGAAPIEDASVLPVIGLKEFVALLVSQLGFGPGARVALPAMAYPTYAVGATLAGADWETADAPEELSAVPDVVWLNSPANPSGRILSPDQLRAWVAYCREHEVILASDECYGEFGWDADVVSVLHPDISGNDHHNILAAFSLSKRSNLAGYRAGFVAGDPALIRELTEVRKHSGFMLPAPVQAAMAVALRDQSHVEQQRERYLRRRQPLRAALEGAGFRIEHSEGGLYLWATRDESSWDSIDWLAERGILASPGAFYGEAGRQHVRVALTALDERIEAAVERLS